MIRAGGMRDKNGVDDTMIDYPYRFCADAGRTLENRL
jgi:hypothetical protein